MNQLFTIRLDQQRFALRLQDVERVVRMVEITALPEAPSGVLGLINLQGRVLSVIDLRGYFHLPPREIEPEDVLVIVRTAGGMVALAADGVEVVGQWPEQTAVAAEESAPVPAHPEGVVKLPDGLMLICDLDRVLAGGKAPGFGGDEHDAR